MRLIILLAIMLNLLIAKTVQTPFEILESIHFSGKVTSQSFEIKHKWLKQFEKQISQYLINNGFQQDVGILYKKSIQIHVDKINNYKYLSKKYKILATNKFDLQKPTLKIMINYLDDSYADYQELITKRNKGIEETQKELLKQPSQISQQFFIYKNAYSGFDITFTEQHITLDNQEGGRLRVGVFADGKESYLFVDDKLSSKSWLAPKTNITIQKLKKLIVEEINSFYKPQKLLAYKFIAKKQQVISSEKLVTTAISDDSDSSRVECDSDLTLNSENVSVQLKKIDMYIYKIAPFNDAFLLPDKSEGAVWKSFYWKHKKNILINKLSLLGNQEKDFLTLLATFVQQKRNELKRLLVQEDFSKIQILFEQYWSKHKIHNKQIEDFLTSVDIVDLIALGLK